MNPDTYPVEWSHRDKPVTLHMGKLSAGLKKQFSNWLKPRLLADARTWMPPAEFEDYRDSLVEPSKEKAFWSASPSRPVADALVTREGSVQLNRLLFGDGVKGWTDDEIWALLESKDKDPESDYRIAFALVWDEAHPKAKAAVTSPTPPPSDGADPAVMTASSVS